MLKEKVKRNLNICHMLFILLQTDFRGKTQETVKMRCLTVIFLDFYMNVRSALGAAGMW